MTDGKACVGNGRCVAYPSKHDPGSDRTKPAPRREKGETEDSLNSVPIPMTKTARKRKRRKRIDVQFAMMEKVKILMRLFSAMGVIWRFIKVSGTGFLALGNKPLLMIMLGLGQTATVFHTFQKVNGSVANAPFPPIVPSPVSFARTKGARSSKLRRESGRICCVPCGYRRRASPIQFTWNRSIASKESPKPDGSW